jgi:hypothetical protein
MADRYYVETWLPSALRAEAHALFPTFDRAMAWLERRLGENSERIGRFDTGAQLTPEQTEKLDRHRIEHFLGPLPPSPIVGQSESPGISS